MAQPVSQTTPTYPFATRAQEDHTLGHPAVFDLMAREILDFPLGHGSFCRCVTGEVAATLLARRERFAHLLPAEGTPRSERFASSRRSFYQMRARGSAPPSSERGSLPPPSGRAGLSPPSVHRGTGSG